MDRIANPFSPGAGAMPAELAGRDILREDVRVAVGRVRAGRTAKHMILIGLRGTGKTVLLNRMRQDLENDGVHVARLEANERRSLPGLLVPELRVALLAMSRIARAKDLARRGLRGLAGFTRAIKAKYHDVELALEFSPEPGLADTGHLEDDLKELLAVMCAAAKASGSALVLCIDELQYVEPKQLGALIEALHRASQDALPVALVAAGLPPIRAQIGAAKTYAERMFTFTRIGALGKDDAKDAIVKPLDHLGVSIASDAVSLVLKQTQGYPYFLQEWGSATWNAAAQSPIQRRDVEVAASLALAGLDASFFPVRFEHLTDAEKRYLRAMAELGPGPHRSGAIANELGRKVTATGALRSHLIQKGVIWSPSRGETAFSVPLFDGFMRRILPGEDWRAG